MHEPTLQHELAVTSKVDRSYLRTILSLRILEGDDWTLLCSIV